MRYLQRILCTCVMSSAMATAHAALVDVAHDGLTHFANFVNDPPAGALSRISAADTPTSSGDFGWHNSPSELLLPNIAGVFLAGPEVVIKLRFITHTNPFADFTLQGSNNSGTGLDGSWINLLSENVPHNVNDFDIVEWDVVNTVAYGAYRIHIPKDYVGGWAMFRWDLLAAETVVVPLPAALPLLLAAVSGLGVVVRRRVAVSPSR